MPEENIDSLAYWGDDEWIIATAKSTHRLLVFSAADGRLLRTYGEEGGAPGQFRRPNGVAVVGNLLLVTERDNRRVQLFRLPELTSLGFLGAGTVRAPYGVAAFRSDRGIEAYVTDNYLRAGDAVPADADLGERVRHFFVVDLGGSVESTLVRNFGATSGDGVLHVVESIAADPERGRLLIADEWENALSVKVYGLDGAFIGPVIGQGLFIREPEGLALVPCDGGGFWIATDQRTERTVFLLFDRTSLRPLGSFTGKVVANTDGIAVMNGRLGPSANGGLLAVNSDSSVAAFSLAEIERALGIGIGCGDGMASPPARPGS
jgi:3-phytase